MTTFPDPIAEPIEIGSPDMPLCRVYRFVSGNVVLAFGRAPLTLSIHLSADEASALADALGEALPEERT